MAENEQFTKYWWEEPKTTVHETLFSILRFLDQNQGYRREMDLRHIRLYGNLNVLGLSAYTYAKSDFAGGSSQVDRVTLNVVQSCCDTATQKIAKNKPKPTFLTEGGNPELKRRAKNLTKFVQGQFYATRMYEQAPIVFLHGTVLGTGAMKIYREKDQIKIEPTLAAELRVDDAEAMYGKPRSLYQIKAIPKEALARIYPEYAFQIKTAKLSEISHVFHPNLSDCVQVVEAWHLGSEENPGRHVIAIENCTLLDEPWTKDYFPFAFIRWSPRLLGFFGQGLAEQLTGLQIAINKILRDIQVAFHLFKPKLIVKHGSKILKAHLNNEIGTVIETQGEPPIPAPMSAVPQEWFSHLFWLYQRAYEIAGISQLSANSQKPAGLNSGKALREFNDIETERFILVGQAWEQFFMEAARQMIDLAKEISEEYPDFAVTVRGRSSIERIRWEDVNLEADKYVLQVFPTSSLSSTPSGRLQDIQELIQAGFIDRASAMDLLDLPDLEAFMSRVNAPIRNIEKQIADILEKGEEGYRPPEPFQNLQLALTMFQEAYLQAVDDGEGEDRLELLRRWMAQAKETMDQAQPQQAPAQVGQPTAAPMPAQKSDLIPNVPGAVGAMPSPGMMG
jgi:hypothetical protein